MAKADKAAAENAEENKTPQADASKVHSKKQVQSVEFGEAAGTEAADSPGKLDIILDMNVPITVAIGRTEMPVRQLLQLGPGSVLKLNKPIDAPADLFLKDSLFAQGDVVVVDERFAIRIKQIIGANRDKQ
ncbi:MAG: FliM/FliN family flagellar motor switch protein [Sedimentisphaerales bacterium]